MPRGGQPTQKLSMRGSGFDPFGEQRQQPPMSAELFGTLLVGRLRAVPGIVIRARHRLELKLAVEGEERVVHLEADYDRYRASPDELTPIVERVIRRIQAGEQEPAAAEAYEAVAASLMPRLVTSEEWTRWRDRNVRLLVRPLVQDLGLAVVIDRPSEVAYVQLEALGDWDVEIADIFDRALANLEDRSRDVAYSRSGEGEQTVAIDREPDGYAAARAVLPSRLEQWSSLVGGELVVGLPTRDLAIGFSRRHAAFEELQRQVARDAREQPAGLYPDLLFYRQGQLERLSAEV